MTRPHAPVAALAWLALGASWSCANGPVGSSTPDCVPLSLVTARVVAGSIAFTVPGTAPETHLLGPDDPVVTSGDRSDRCKATGLVTALGQSAFMGLASEGGALVQCEPFAGSVQVATGRIDPTKLKVETYGADPALVVFVGTLVCSASVMAPVRVDVTRAEGGTAPYPVLLTPDYVRELTIHADTGPIDAATVNGCPLASVRVELQLIETASDVTPDPSGSCLSL